MCNSLSEEELIISARIKDIFPGDGKAVISADIVNSVFYEIITDISGVVRDLTLKRFCISVSSSCFVLTSIKIEGVL